MSCSVALFSEAAGGGTCRKHKAWLNLQHNLLDPLMLRVESAPSSCPEKDVSNLAVNRLCQLVAGIALSAAPAELFLPSSTYLKSLTF
jgi:hypothetical protein